MAKPSEAGPAAMSETKLRAAARERTELALETLVGLMSDEAQASVKLAAAREMLDRAYGRPSPASPKSKAKLRKDARDRGLTVIVKRFSDVTPEEQAAAEATERGEL